MTILAEDETMTYAEPDAGSARGRRASADGASPIVRAAERLVQRIETLVDEIARLRADNAKLRVEVQEAVALLDRASSAGPPEGGRRSRVAVGLAPAPPQRRKRGRGRVARGRATPPEVTPQVVEAAIAKLGEGTASEIADEITRAGVRVSGRAIRFLAERAGAETYRGDDGQRRYRLGGR
jgi:uncharacterized small protein (DUF1192 family)